MEHMPIPSKPRKPTHLRRPDSRPVVVEELGYEVDVYGVVGFQLIAQGGQGAEGGWLGSTKSEISLYL